MVTLRSCHADSVDRGARGAGGGATNGSRRRARALDLFIVVSLVFLLASALLTR